MIIKDEELYSNTIQKWSLELWWSITDNFDDAMEQIVSNKEAQEVYEYAIVKNIGKIITSTREMLTLLLNGYPDGALSIARTIYEYYIITKFIFEKRDNEVLLQKYFADQDIKAYKSRIELYKGLQGNQTIPQNILDDMINTLTIEIVKLQNKYGKMNWDYWWTSDIVREGSFAAVDKYINSDALLRVLYKRACISIHASSMGASAILGRECEKWDAIFTNTTADGFQAPLLLGMVSLENVIEIVCEYWKKEKKQLIPFDTCTYYQEYLKTVFL